MVGKLVRAGLIAVTASVLCSCASSADPTATATLRYQITTVDGVTVQGEGQQKQGGSGALISGVVELDSAGCWKLKATTGESFDLVWPAGTRWSSPDRVAVRLSTGMVVRSGVSLKGPGGVTERQPRSSISVAPDVACLGSETTTYIALGKPAEITTS